MGHQAAAIFGADVTNPIVLIFAIVYSLLVLYCAYRTAVNRHWLLFILGFFCGGIFWIIGALIGPSR